METSLHSENQPGGITSELEGLLTRTVPEPASRGLRFINLLIDGIIVSIIDQILIITILHYSETIVRTNSYTLIASLFWPYMVYLMYYAVMEASTGRTVGKFCTGTIVARNDGSPLTFKDAFLRSICRWIPFEFISGFWTPWHDSITKTRVVKKAQL